MSFKIVTDTSSNLPLSRLVGEDITIVPFTYYPKDDPSKESFCIDIENFDGKKYYNDIRNGNLMNTSQINPQRFYDEIAPYAKAGQDILYVGMSSGISGAYNSSLTAKQMLLEDFPDRQFFMLDTRSASLAEGIVVLKAIEYRKQGMTVEECYNALLPICDKIYQIFTVDSITHLQRTGRLSNAAAFIGNILNIKPILKGNDKGQIINVAKMRGNKKAIQELARRYDEVVLHPEEQIVCIADCDNKEDTNYLIELLNKNNPPKEILNVTYEPVTGAHVGPGAVALFFMGDSDARTMQK